MTPLRIVFGWGWPALLRRLLGLFAFTYAVLHFSVWILVDHFFNWGQMTEDVVKRPYITVGMLALLTLIPLALTSTTAMIRRLGARRWTRLHRLVYLTRSEEHTSELQSLTNLVCRLLLEKKNTTKRRELHNSH